MSCGMLRGRRRELKGIEMTIRRMSRLERASIVYLIDSTLSIKQVRGAGEIAGFRGSQSFSDPSPSR